ncbi:MAG: hypothetical protein M0Z31_13735 [Clostridia bacterium]|nr:hypothetical protein [Clostridia bacterium]
MERRELIRLLRRINETVDENKEFLDELDNRGGKKNLGTLLAWNLQRILHSGINSNNINMMLYIWGDIMAASQEPVTRYYGNTIKKVLKNQQETETLNGALLITFAKGIMNEVNQEKKLSRVNTHLPMWERLLTVLEDGAAKELSTKEMLRLALTDFQWKLPKTANRSITLARLLIIRTIVLELGENNGHSHI